MRKFPIIMRNLEKCPECLQRFIYFNFIQRSQHARHYISHISSKPLGGMIA
jgi:hypothetical protein